MEKHITNEKTGLSYTLVGDYYIPNLTLPEEPEHPIGRFGRMHLKFLREHRRVFYVNLFTSGKLNEHLRQIDEQANERFDTLVAAYARADDTDEHLKAHDQLRWVGLMNNYRSCAEEVVMEEIVCE